MQNHANHIHTVWIKKKFCTNFHPCVLIMINMSRAEHFCEHYLFHFWVHSLAYGHSLVYLWCQQFCKHIYKINDLCVSLSGNFLPSFVQTLEKIEVAYSELCAETRASEYWKQNQEWLLLPVHLTAICLQPVILLQIIVISLFKCRTFVIYNKYLTFSNIKLK
jgi:hypothetical protein